MVITHIAQDISIILQENSEYFIAMAIVSLGSSRIFCNIWQQYFENIIENIKKYLYYSKEKRL